jgi:peroxin-3
LMESGLQYPSSSQGISPQLRSLLNETQDFIDSPDFSIVLRSCLDQSFEVLSSSLAHLFVDMPDVSAGRFEEVPAKKVRLAAILPALARASHSVLEDSPNEFADALGSNRELQEFSAVVFSHFVLE